MLFALSKILWFVVQPLNLAIFALTGAMIAMYLRRPLLARKLGILSFTVLFVFAVLPTGPLLVRTLETRHAAPDPMPARVSGIILLGGALDSGQGMKHGVPQMNALADRVNAFVVLARRYPRARLVFTGGIGALDGHGTPEGAMIRPLLATYGFEPGARLVVDDAARTTAENAALTRAMVKDGETWLLVTSAWHMPRALGAYRAQGLGLVPAPADYLTGGTDGTSFFQNLNASHIAVKELIGIAGYALAGKWTSHEKNAQPAAR